MILGSGKVKVLKRRPYIFDEIKFTSHSKNNYLRGAKDTKSNILFRQNIFGTEIIWGDFRFMFPTRKGRKGMQHLYIFAMVKRDALAYIKKHRVRKIKWNSSIIYNNNAVTKGRRLVGSDIDEAYWHIAYRMKVISRNTYEKGLNVPDKRLLLASLSTLGRDKRYVQYRDGKPTADVVIIKGNDDLKNLYKTIRHTCYGYMKKLAAIIGNDFVAYKTDCIYYLYTAENVRKVRFFLDKYEIDYKMVRDYKHFADFVDD